MAQSFDSQQPVLHVLSGDIWGGAEAQALVQLKALRKLGWNVEVLFFNRGESLDRYTQARIPCAVIEESGGLRTWATQLVRFAREQRPKLIVAHGYKESFAAFVMTCSVKTPWISVFHGLTEQNRGIQAIKMSCYRWLHLSLSRSSASAVVTVSRNLGETLGFTRWKHWLVIWNAAPQLEQSFAVEPVTLDQPAIVVVGRLAPVKRIDRALEAFDLLFQQRQTLALPLPHLYVVGSGPLERQLPLESARLAAESHIHFLGFRSDSSRIIRDAACVLISSDSEGVPTVLLEAIQLGTPVVATPVGGIPEVLAELTGARAFAVSSMSATALTDALARVLSEHAESSAEPSWLQSLSDNFSPEAAARKHDSLYRALLNSK